MSVNLYCSKSDKNYDKFRLLSFQLDAFSLNDWTNSKLFTPVYKVDLTYSEIDQCPSSF